MVRAPNPNLELNGAKNAGGDAAGRLNMLRSD